jgi:hypothetical protein
MREAVMGAINIPGKPRQRSGARQAGRTTSHVDDAGKSRASQLRFDRPRGVSGPTLVVGRGNNRGSIFPIKANTVVVGRSLQSDVILNDETISRSHFRLERQGEAYRLIDLGSFNGTKVDGERQPEVTLTDGMVINIGQSTLVWWSGSLGATDSGPHAASATVRPSALPPAGPMPPTDPKVLIKVLIGLVGLLTLAVILLVFR